MTTDNKNEEANTTLFSELFHNIKRHNLITTVAERLLDDETRAALEDIISPLPFARFGGWADELRSNPPTDPETRRFLQDPRNADPSMWHFVNLPLGIEGYSQAQAMGFTRDNDVVQMVRHCVLVLTDRSDRFSKVNALRWMSHLVGDIHQPIHIGCSFIDESGGGSVPRLAFDPQVIIDKGLAHDRGGNRLLLPGSGKMHSYWDGVLGGNIQPDEITPLAVTVEANISAAGAKEMAVEKLFQLAEEANASGSTMGLAANALPIERRAEQWADESLQAAREAYRNIEIVGRQGNSFKVSWEGRTTIAGKAPYDARCAPVLLKRMTAGARNLANLLKDVLT